MFYFSTLQLNSWQCKVILVIAALILVYHSYYQSKLGALSDDVTRSFDTAIHQFSIEDIIDMKQSTLKRLAMTQQQQQRDLQIQHPFPYTEEIEKTYQQIKDEVAPFLLLKHSVLFDTFHHHPILHIPCPPYNPFSIPSHMFKPNLTLFDNCPLTIRYQQMMIEDYHYLQQHGCTVTQSDSPSSSSSSSPYPARLCALHTARFQALSVFLPFHLTHTARLGTTSLPPSPFMQHLPQQTGNLSTSSTPYMVSSPSSLIMLFTSAALWTTTLNWLLLTERHSIHSLIRVVIICFDTFCEEHAKQYNEDRKKRWSLLYSHDDINDIRNTWKSIYQREGMYWYMAYPLFQFFLSSLDWSHLYTPIYRIHLPSHVNTIHDVQFRSKDMRAMIWHRVRELLLSVEHGFTISNYDVDALLFHDPYEWLTDYQALWKNNHNNVEHELFTAVLQHGFTYSASILQFSPYQLPLMQLFYAHYPIAKQRDEGDNPAIYEIFIHEQSTFRYSKVGIEYVIALWEYIRYYRRTEQRYLYRAQLKMELYQAQSISSFRTYTLLSDFLYKNNILYAQYQALYAPPKCIAPHDCYYYYQADYMDNNNHAVNKQLLSRLVSNDNDHDNNNGEHKYMNMSDGLKQLRNNVYKRVKNGKFQLQSPHLWNSSSLPARPYFTFTNEFLYYFSLFPSSYNHSEFVSNSANEIYFDSYCDKRRSNSSDVLQYRIQQQSLYTVHYQCIKGSLGKIQQMKKDKLWMLHSQQEQHIQQLDTWTKNQ